MKFTDEELITELQRFYEENGRFPKMKDMIEENGYIDRYVFKSHFGTWNKALLAAELKLNKVLNFYQTGDEVCENCGSEKDDKCWYYDKDKNNKRLCSKCYNKRDHKYGNLDPHSSTGFAFLSQRVVYKTLNIDFDCNCKIGFNSSYDLKDNKYGKIDVKSSKIPNIKNKSNNKWKFETDKFEKADYYIMLGFSEDKKDIIHVWNIPTNENIVLNKQFLVISNSETGLSRVKEFEVDAKLYNETYHSMSIDNCPVLRKS